MNSLAAALENPLIVACYGGGTNSTAYLVGLKERGIRPDAILFSDTGGERPHTYENIRVVNQWLKKIGYPQITIVRVASKTLEQDCLDRHALPSVVYGFKTCSQRFKTEPQDKWLNNWDRAKEEWAAGRKVVKIIGYDYDETRRAKNYDSDKYENWYPLIEWKWGREECVQAIARAGLPQPGKSSCFFCPNMKKPEIREMAAHYPELADRAIRMEKNAELRGDLVGLGRGYRWEALLATPDMFEYDDRNTDMPCGCYDGD